MASNENIRERMSRMNAVKNQCIRNKNSYFVEHSENSVTVLNERLGEEQTVSLVVNDAEGPDTALVFSLKTTDVVVGDYLTWKETSHFLVTESVKVIKDVDYNKFRAFECNVLINKNIRGYLIGSKQAAKDIKLSNRFETSKLLPTLICPVSSGIKIDDQITIDNQIWDVVEADTISNPGIGYYYIERGTNTMSSQGRMPKDKGNYAYKRTELTLPSEDGYFRSDVDLEIVRRTAESVTFKVPSEDFIIYTLVNGAEKENKYIVKESV